MKLLIAYDGSECSQLALEDLRRSGLPATADAMIIAVAEVWLTPPPHPLSYEILSEGTPKRLNLLDLYGTDAPIVKEAKEFTDRAASVVHDIFPQWDITTEVCCGSPAGELIAKADDWQPELIIAGSHGRTALGRLFLGSVSQKLITEARCSVRVGRGLRKAPEDPVRLIIGVDGSPGSDSAVLAVAKRTWPGGSEARLVTSTSPFRDYWPSIRVKPEDLSLMQQRAAPHLSAAGLQVSSKIDAAEPKQLLIDEAASFAADCIFVGAKGLTFFERIVLGSVSAGVAARAACSVEVVRSI